MRQYTLADGQVLTPGVSFASRVALEEESIEVSHPPNWADVCGPGNFVLYGVTVTDIPDLEPPSSPRRMIEKATIVSRLTDEQLGQALGLMSNRQKERWRTPGYPSVFADDPEILTILAAIEANPEIILAP